MSRGGLVPHPQAEDGVTYAHKLSSADAEIDWQTPGAAIDGHIRGLNPVPGAWTTMPGADAAPTRLKLWMSRVLEGTSAAAAPGEVVALTDDGIDIAAGDHTLVRLTRLQRPGKAAQDAVTFLRGVPLKVGDRLGQATSTAPNSDAPPNQ